MLTLEIGDTHIQKHSSTLYGDRNEIFGLELIV